ncbi:MAG: hypothetical protein IJ004_01410 [Clostridia bacterium]|nr:hypothetical protein [Clostridia bacterium]
MNDTKGSNEKKELSFAEQLNLADNAEKRKEELGKQELEKIKKELQVICDEMYKEFFDGLYESVKKAIMEKVKNKDYITKKGKKIVKVYISTWEQKRLPKELMDSFERRIMEYDMFCNIHRYDRADENGNVVGQDVYKSIMKYDFARELGIRFHSDNESSSFDYYEKVIGYGTTNRKSILIIGIESLPVELISILDMLCERLRKDNIIFSGIYDNYWSKPGKLLLKDYRKSRISTEWHSFYAGFTMEF